MKQPPPIPTEITFDIIEMIWHVPSEEFINHGTEDEIIIETCSCDNPLAVNLDGCSLVPITAPDPVPADFGIIL